MSNILKEFLAARTNRATSPSIINTGQPVTREEFGTLVKVVEALVEDVQSATSPEKLSAAFNEALKPLMNGLQTNGSGVRGQFRAPLALPADGEGPGAQTLANGRRDRGFIAPADDDVGDIMPPRVNSKFGYKLPEGD